jgi:hypothetical protein
MKEKETNWGVCGFPADLRRQVTATAKRRGIATTVLVQQWVEDYLKSPQKIKPLKRPPKKDTPYWVVPNFPCEVRQEFIAKTRLLDCTVAALLIPVVHTALRGARDA